MNSEAAPALVGFSTHPSSGSLTTIMRKGLSTWRCAATVLMALSLVGRGNSQVPQSQRNQIDRIIGTHGFFVPDEGVYKVTLPREAVTIVLDYQTLPATMGFNSWAAFKSSKGDTCVLIGQFLLLEDEVDAAITSALDKHLQVDGLADESFSDGPRRKVLDVSAKGTYDSLASAFRSVLDTLQNTAKLRLTDRHVYVHPTLMLDSSISAKPIDEALAIHGVLANGVYRADIGRKGTLFGEGLGRETGLATWLSISGSDERALANGEVAATAGELQAVVRALNSKHFHVVSIRNHIVGEQPTYYFVRYWMEGRAIELAQSFHSVLIGHLGMPTQ